MVSIRKKRRSIRRLLSQLDDFYQHVNIGNAMNNKQENTTVKEGSADQEIKIGKCDSVLEVKENVVNVKTLERFSNERIDKEMGNTVDTVDDKIQNAIVTAIDSITSPEIELALRSKKSLLEEL